MLAPLLMGFANPAKFFSLLRLIFSICKMGIKPISQGCCGDEQILVICLAK